MACCACCAKTGACCHPDSTCTDETCAECESLGGQWQGSGTACEAGSCPCDPPADRGACERCRDGAVETFCSEGQNCCSGACQKGACGGCTTDQDCCVCDAFIFLGNPCPDGWTRADYPYGEWYCFSPELPMPCGNRTQECEDIRQQLIAAEGYDDNYGESPAGYCCDNQCSREACPP